MESATSHLQPHELKDALTSGLYPAADTAGPAVEGWDGLDAIRAEHEEVIEDYSNAAHVHYALTERFKRQDEGGRADTDYSERQRLLHEAKVERERTRKAAEATVARLVDEARELLDEWRAVQDAAESERKAEIEQLRARLVELETEDLTNRRLAVWLDRMDPELVTPGLYPWAAMAATPAPPHLPTGPIAQSFQPHEEGLT